MLGGNLEGWDGEGRWEGMYVHTRLIHAVIQQKLAQYCEAIIPQWRKKQGQSRLLAPLVIAGVEGSLASAHCQTRDWLLSVIACLSRTYPCS